MIGISEADGRAIRARILERQYPQIKAQLGNGEVLLSVSGRAPVYIPGLFCILIGLFFAAQIAGYFLLSSPVWWIPVLLFCVSLVWAGIRLVFLVKTEYVFVTDKRVTHQRVDLLGRISKTPVLIYFTEITGVRLYRGVIAFRSQNATTGDVFVRKNKGSYLTPTLSDGVGLTETLIAELKRQRINIE